jgi:WD40 repeat protein
MLQTIEGRFSSINSIAFSPDGKVLASGSNNKTIWLWDTVTGAALQTLEGHLLSVRSVRLLSGQQSAGLRLGRQHHLRLSPSRSLS